MTEIDNSPDDESSGGSSTRVNRRKFLYTSGVASVAALAGCTSGGGGGGEGDDTDTPTEAPTESGKQTSTTSENSLPYEGQTLKASIWSGETVEGWREHIVPPFEEMTGATVELVPGWSEITAKIKSAPEDNPPYDVTVGDGYVHSNGINAELFQPIRYENVPNFENVFPFFQEFRNPEYGVPVAGMPMTILYREDQDFKPTSWSDFGTDAGVEANLGMEGSWYAYPAHIAALTMDDLPKADEMYDEEYHEAVFDTLGSWDVNSWYGGGSEFWEALRNGVVDAAQYYMNTHKQAQEEENIGFQYPQDGSVWYWDHHHVVRGTSVRRLAEEWINFLLDPEMQTTYADFAYVAPANQEATLEKAILKENYPQSNDEWEENAVFFDVPYLQSNWETFSNLFKEVKRDS